MGRKLPTNLTTALLLESETQVPSDRAPLSVETRARARSLLTVCRPPSHSLRFFLGQMGGAGQRGPPSHLQTCGAEGSPGCQGGLGELRKGEWRPPSFSPDQGGDVSPLKTSASNQTPCSVVPIPLSVPVSLVFPAPFWEVVIVPIFIVKQVPVPPAALPGPAG